MTTDGAHLGLGPHDAMQGAIAGMSPEEVQERRTTTAGLAAKIAASVHPHEFHGDDSYDNGACYAAKLILGFLREHPEAASAPAESIYDWTDFKGDGGILPVITPGLDKLMEDHGVSLKGLGLTGFMYGWAVNAARAICELPPVPNPAIVEIG